MTHRSLSPSHCPSSSFLLPFSLLFSILCNLQNSLHSLAFLKFPGIGIKVARILPSLTLTPSLSKMTNYFSSWKRKRQWTKQLIKPSRYSFVSGYWLSILSFFFLVCFPHFHVTFYITLFLLILTQKSLPNFTGLLFPHWSNLQAHGDFWERDAQAGVFGCL